MIADAEREKMLAVHTCGKRVVERLARSASTASPTSVGGTPGI